MASALSDQDVIHLGSLTPEERRKVQRALRPRDFKFSLMFRKDDVKAWRKEAKLEGFPRLSDWMEHVLNAAVKTERCE